MFDVGAIAFGFIDVVRAERRGDISHEQAKVAMVAVGVGAGLSLAGYVPYYGLALGPVLEGSIYGFNLKNLTGSLNPFKDW